MGVSAIKPRKPRPFLSGMAIGLHELTGLEFRIDKPHTFCRICGAIYQSSLDRRDHPLAIELRRDWSYRHARLHPDHEHRSLMLSGRFMTPEAQIELASFGILDLHIDDEITQSLFESKAIPKDDTEG